MKWSKLKHTIESRFAKCIQGRIHLYAAVYENYDRDGRVWITFDKKEIVNFCDFNSFNQHGLWYNDSSNSICMSHPSPSQEDRLPAMLAEKGEFSKNDAYLQLFSYLNLSIEEALTNEGPIINAVAMLDKRLGKRRLALIDPDQLHPLPKALLRLRLELEGIAKPGKNADLKEQECK